MRSRMVGEGVPREFFARVLYFGIAVVEEWKLKDWLGKERITERDWGRLLMDWQDYTGDTKAMFYAKTTTKGDQWVFMTEEFTTGIMDEYVSNENYGD